MSSISMDMIVGGFAIVNVILLVASLKMGRAPTTPTLEELMRAAAEAASKQHKPI